MSGGPLEGVRVVGMTTSCVGQDGGRTLAGPGAGGVGDRERARQGTDRSPEEGPPLPPPRETSG